MTPPMVLEGIYTRLITLFHADGSFDLDALADLIERLLAAGVHGVVSGGSTGKNYAKTVEERLGTGAFHHRARGRAPAGRHRHRRNVHPDSIALAQGARDMGADAILLGTPPCSVPTEQENALNALAIDRACGPPIILYNYPGRMSVAMGRDFLDRVGRSKNVIGIKESLGDINRVHLLARDYPHIQMSCGMDDQALEFFAWGARSWICAGQGDFVRGRRIMSAMLPPMAVLEQGGKFIQCVKHGVEATGGRAGPMRPPLKGPNKDEKRALEKVIRMLKTTVAAMTEGN